MKRRSELASAFTRKRFWFAAALGVGVFYYTIKQADFQNLIDNVRNIDPFWTAMVVLCGVLSYLSIGAVLYCLLKNVGYDVPFSSAFKISLLSSTLNYLMAIGGLSGVAAKVYLLSREKIPPSKTLSISMVHGFLTNTVAVLFIYLGFFFMYSEYRLDRKELAIGWVILFVAFLLTWITIQTIVHEAFRKKLWNLICRIGSIIGRLLRRPTWFHEERADAFFENFNDSMNLIVKDGRRLLAPTGYAILDWALMFLCLKFSFLAVHYPIDNRSLLIGFSVGTFAGIFSLTPASIGVMEGSMAWAFSSMGKDFNSALLATLLYRVAYYFLPILVSTLFYKQFFPSSRQPKIDK